MCKDRKKLTVLKRIVAIPEYKLKVVSICEMHEAGGLEVIVFYTV